MAPRTPPPVDEDGFLCLRGDRLWKWRALDAELRAAGLALESTKRQIQAELAAHPELAALFAKQVSLLGEVSLAKSELGTVLAEIEKEFGVSLKECAFDDKTGRLYNLTAEGARGIPLKPKRRTRVGGSKGR